MHNGYELDRAFGIHDKVNQGNILLKYIFGMAEKYKWNKLVYFNPRVEYDKNAFHNNAPFMYGYWMNEQYFKSIEEEIRKVFKFKGIDDKNKEIADSMLNECSVSIHIRRGDYLKLPNWNVCGTKYILNAIRIIYSKVKNPKFYVFSDEPEWCKVFFEEMHIPHMVISHNTGIDSYKDMYLMHCCKHNIICNSTFSWWGAWLNSNVNKIVVAPKKWWRNCELNPSLDSWILSDID